MIQRSPESIEKLGNMIVRVYDDEPDKSNFVAEWKPDMAQWLNHGEILKSKDGSDAGFFGWMEYKDRIFVIVGVLQAYRNEIMRNLLEVGKKHLAFANKVAPKKKIYGLTTRNNKNVHSIARVLGINICYEMPEGLER